MVKNSIILLLTVLFVSCKKELPVVDNSLLMYKNFLYPVSFNAVIKDSTRLFPLDSIDVDKINNSHIKRTEIAGTSKSFILKEHSRAFGEFYYNLFGEDLPGGMEEPPIIADYYYVWFCGTIKRSPVNVYVFQIRVLHTPDKKPYDIVAFFSVLNGQLASIADVAKGTPYEFSSMSLNMIKYKNAFITYRQSTPRQICLFKIDRIGFTHPLNIKAEELESIIN